VEDESMTARVTARNNTAAKAKMVVIDLGIPPGFEASGEDLAELVYTSRGKGGGELEKYTTGAKQVILRLDGLNPSQAAELTFRLRAKFPRPRTDVPRTRLRILRPRRRGQYKACCAVGDREVKAQGVETFG
jgi:hypothetical protein